MVFFVWCSVVVFFGRFNDLLLCRFNDLRWGNAGEAVAQRRGAVFVCENRGGRPAARGVLRSAAAPRCVAGGPRRARRRAERVAAARARVLERARVRFRPAAAPTAVRGAATYSLRRL